MTESTQDRLSMIRNMVGDIKLLSMSDYPTPVTDEDRIDQQHALDALDQAQLAWLLMINLICSEILHDPSQPRVLNRELDNVISCFDRFKSPLFPPCKGNREIYMLLDLAERALDRALTALRLVPRASDGRLVYATP